MQQFLFIDLFEPAVHVSGNKLTHFQEHFRLYTALVQCTNRQQYRCIVAKLCIQLKVFLKVGEFVARNM